MWSRLNFCDWQCQEGKIKCKWLTRRVIQVQSNLDRGFWWSMDYKISSSVFLFLINLIFHSMLNISPCNSFSKTWGLGDIWSHRTPTPSVNTNQLIRQPLSMHDYASSSLSLHTTLFLKNITIFHQKKQ